MLFDELCPNTPYGVIDMCYEEVRNRIVDTASLICELTYPLCGVPPLPVPGVPDDCSTPISPLDEDLYEPPDRPDDVGGPLVLGQEHYYGMNSDGDADGVVDGLRAHGQNDFPNAAHWDHDQYSGIQAVQIFSNAVVDHACGTRGGDVGVHKTHRASNGDIFSAQARVRIVRESDPAVTNFYVRLTFHPMRDDQSIIRNSECNETLWQETPEDRWYEISEVCQMPASEVGNVRINVRAHARPRNGQPGPNQDFRVAGSGTLEIDWFKFSKLGCAHVSCV